MVKKAKSSSKSTGTNRYSSPMIITGVVLVVVMIGGLIAAIFAYSNRGDNTSTEVIIEEVTDCPAEDGTQERKLNFEKRPVWCLKNGHTYTAIFNTSEGEIKVSLDTDRTPETVNNFIVLSRFKYYDDTLLFRFDPSLAIIQGGSPHTNDWSDPGPGYTIPDEGGLFSTSGGSTFGPFTYEAGQLVMARSSGPNSSGAQFFFTTGDEVAVLNGQGSYIVFGETDEEGLTVLQTMMDLYEVDETSPYGGGPIRDVVVNSVEILADPVTN